MASKFRLFPTSVLTRLSEMRLNSLSPSIGGLRSVLSSLRWGYYKAPTTPALSDTKIDKDKVREIYYNTNTSYNQGAFLARPIIDGTADFIGIPSLSVQDAQVDKIMNDWVNKHWKKQLWEIYRNTLRDADSWVRLRRPFPGPLVAPEDDQAIELELYDSDRVTPYYHPATGQLLRVEILTITYIEDEPFDPLQIYARGLHAHGREHEIIEIITPDFFMYYDATINTLLENYTTTNEWGFVPCIQIFNDFDSALHGGISELECVYPFFVAIHDLVIQTRTAHKNHANPKVKFKLDDVMNFIRNNFPESLDDAGHFTGKVSWKDTDVFFMESEEDAEFIEAQMRTNDSVALMEFLIDCVCIAGKVTESVLFRAKSEGTTNNDEFERFKQKIIRKRENFESYIQEIAKMGLKIILDTPARPTVTWPYIQTSDMVQEATALNQFVTAAEVANRAKAISLETYRDKIRPFFPTMSDDTNETAQINKEVAADQQQQLDFEKKMLALNPTPTLQPPGPNGAKRNGRTPLPMNAIPTSTGN